MSRPRSLLVSVALGLVLALASIAVANTGSATRAAVLTVGGPAATGPIPAGFLGLSLEYFAVPAYAGTNPSATNPVFVQLIRNLAGGNPPELRIGGDTTDRTWWPIPGMRTPAGVTNTLTPAWIAVAKAVAEATGAKLTLGIDFEADSAAVAGSEANQLVDGIGAASIAALELGNEPELYGSFTWGRSGEPGRPRNYDFAAFSRDFTRIARALPTIPLAGPAAGSPKWFTDIGRFLGGHPQIKVTTLHRYPLQLCYIHRNRPDYPTISNLLSPLSSQGLAESVAAAVSASHARHVPVRIDEMNTIGCGSDRAVGESFASALWALDSMFNMARVGVDGVNIATFPSASFQLFNFSESGGTWRALVEPEYYGLEMFAQAAPAGSRLLKVSETGAGNLREYVTRAPDGTVRVVAINETTTSRVVRVRVGGDSQTGTLQLLTAPSLRSTSGVTLGGRSFGGSTTTGVLAGPSNTDAVAPTRGEYAVQVPHASAAMLTLPPG
ncbi:MAG: glycosyl hydrolase family 79 C-terminal domain-containing protein [Solirubrobacteraceae bacterium]